jgi:uncharacterized protein (TIGR00251 family)
LSAHIAVKVKPNSHKTGIKSYRDGILNIDIAASPAEGKANQELINYLAKVLELPKSTISIRMGFAGRNKIIDIAGILPDELEITLKRINP